MQPVIVLGQQPNGILPKRFFIAKLRTARRLQQELGGRIIWFCHDADHDPQETRTRIPSDQHPDGFIEINFSFANKTQRKFTPLAHKAVGDLSVIRETLRHHAPSVLDAFDAVQAQTVADWCIQMYQELGLLDGVEVVRSSDPAFRKKAVVDDLERGWFYDTQWSGEIVRARLENSRLSLHRGGDAYEDLGVLEDVDVTRISPGWEKRFDWMQSVLDATHYVAGASEQEYLAGITITRPATMVSRETIDDPSLAFIPEVTKN